MRLANSAIAALASLTLLAAFAGPARAEDWYEVEFIVFKHDNPAAGGTESWPNDPGRPAVELAQALLDPAAGPLLPLTRLEPPPNRLAGAREALERSPRYTPLGYWAWIQPGFERGTEPGVRISVGVPPAAAEVPVDAQGFPLLGAAAELPGAAPPLVAPLDGVIKLGLARYLYASLDLVFRPDGVTPQLMQPPRVPNAVAGVVAAESGPVENGGGGDDATLAPGESVLAAEAPAEPEPPEFQGFRLTETRRLRSREVHYFDHPLFGAILLVTPRTMPDAVPRGN